MARRTAKVKRKARGKRGSRARRSSAPTPELAFPLGWGGVREGAGRKPDPTSGVPHATRPGLKRRHPVHLTWRFASDLPNMRGSSLMAILRTAFEGGCDRFGFHLVHFSVQSNHLHLVAEAEDRLSLARGMQGLGVRIAKRLNRALDRSGRVLSDRYHASQLTTAKQVRNTLRYVINNALKHGVDCQLPDPCSSGKVFNGWKDYTPSPGAWAPVCRARTWLMNVGWLRLGKIGLAESPASTG